jgi:hypothetical protein
VERQERAREQWRLELKRVIELRGVGTPLLLKLSSSEERRDARMSWSLRRVGWVLRMMRRGRLRTVA